MHALRAVLAFAAAASGAVLPDTTIRVMDVKQCLCITNKGPCKCGQTATSQIPVQLPAATAIMTADTGAEHAPSTESFRCVCPEEGHDGRPFGRPCACNIAEEPLWLPKASRVARGSQEEEILPVIPDKPLPPVISPKAHHSPIHCLCFIREEDGMAMPCPCNHATYHLGYVNYID
ncbi:hypothetical protein NLG97_g1909 [Lecanicillium saksenae]|uniref:Uncharacterized protein n=1 Tax=Lecanicillium saksenae TaxID=468837 RepID=A0ACC1R6I7_9HYPO|nr:hypothetical protein NLG97_g1909 [Lecanicillium saksenae]